MYRSHGLKQAMSMQVPIAGDAAIGEPAGKCLFNYRQRVDDSFCSLGDSGRWLPLDVLGGGRVWRGGRVAGVALVRNTAGVGRRGAEVIQPSRAVDDSSL
jgi:hypothetical protein